MGPYSGKGTGESALLRSMLGCFEKNDLVVFDRYCCSYMMLAMLMNQGVHVCARLHHARSSDFRRGRRLGPDDHLVTWTRPPRPAWMSAQLYAEILQTLELREVRFHVHDNNGKTPLSVAREKGNAEMVELLLKHGAKE